MIGDYLYKIRIALSRFSEFLSKHFSKQEHLHTARWALLHELDRLSIPVSNVSQKLTAFLICLGQFKQVFVVQPTPIQKELGNIFIIGKTRAGKGLNIGANLLRWPFPTVINDIKREHWDLTAGFREEGLNGKSYLFDPRGIGHRFDPLEGKETESDLQSAATTLLYRQNEGQNKIFTESAITMLTQIFLAARLEEQRPLPLLRRLCMKDF